MANSMEWNKNKNYSQQCIHGNHSHSVVTACIRRRSAPLEKKMKRIYFHKELILGILFFGLGTLFIGNSLLKEPKEISNWIGFLLSLGFTVFGIHTYWYHKNNKELKSITPEGLKVEFKEKEIIFPNGYYYKYSSMKSNNKITNENVKEINLNTSPPSFVVNNNEVIFVPYKFNENLEEFGNKNGIPITNRFDIWSAINEPFLDTQFDKDEKEYNTKALTKNGLSKKEIKEIRGKIKLTMLSSNSVVWEWVNLSQFDYLNWTWLTKKKYWWSMEIALRNYKKK